MDANLTLRDRVSNELLPRVERPGQYIGGEINQLVQPGDWERARVRVGVVFPDAYTIGMSHLGCQILYWLCNKTPGVCAERVYAPWIDAEQVMRSRRIPLFTWDTRQPVGSADIFAVSLQYELCFTTVLNLLDLAGIPVRAADRDDSHPLVIAGGPQGDNPEPMADFLDLVVMGDGEHAMEEIVAAYREYKDAGVRRRDMILLMARRFPWIYAPNLYQPTYHADGTLAGLLPLHEGLPTRIERCKTPDFEAVPFPQRPLVPWVDVVHDRIAIEVMRGCPQVCRFCHAGYTKRPLTLRSVDRILEIAEEAYWATGHHEIGLLSLSTADYPHLRELAGRMNERFAGRMVNISLPSLRVDKMLANIPWMASAVRKSSLTIAVEAANDDLRAAIRKKVTDGNLLDGITEAYKAGWNRLKLYFMSGFPGERPEDIDAIYTLACKVSAARQRINKPPGHVTASVGFLVPKPFTPLQWMAQPRLEYFREVWQRLNYLQKGGTGVSHLVQGSGAAVQGAVAGESAVQPNIESPKSKNSGRRPKFPVRVTCPRPEMAVLEGVFARGDRRLGAAIEAAWRRGARFDGWDDQFKDAIWQDAFGDAGVDPAFYAHRERSVDELLPWDHIGLHMRRGYLEESYDDVFEKIGTARPAPGISVGGRRGLPVVS